MIQNAQKQLLTKRRTQPRNHVSCSGPTAPSILRKLIFLGKICGFSNLGPFINAIEAAPPTHTIVPTIFATVLQLFAFIFSDLKHYVYFNYKPP